MPSNTVIDRVLKIRLLIMIINGTNKTLIAMFQRCKTIQKLWYPFRNKYIYDMIIPYVKIFLSFAGNQ